MNGSAIFLRRAIRYLVGAGLVAGLVGAEVFCSDQPASGASEKSASASSTQPEASSESIPGASSESLARASSESLPGESVPESSRQPGAMRSPERKPQEGESPGRSAPGRTIRVLSNGVGVLGGDWQAALQEAEQNALAKLYEELNRWAQELTGRPLSPRQLVVEHAWLLSQPGVEQKLTRQEKEKSYGPVVIQAITLEVPQTVLARWAERLHQQHQLHQRRRIYWLVGAVVVTVLGWLLGFGMMVKLDRATGGYYRPLVVLSILVVLGIGTVLGWSIVGQILQEPEMLQEIKTFP